MKNPDRAELEKLSELRGGAEELLRRHISNPHTPSPEEVQSLVHELEVHQIELEMQNRELREAQRLLEESRDRYADLYDFAPLGYVTLDKKGCIQEINLAAAKLLGKERKFLLGMPASTFVVQEQKAALRAHLEKCAQGLDKVTSEFGIVAGDGTSSVVEFHSIPIQDAESGLTLFRTAIADITARKKAEEALRASAEEHRTILLTALDGFWLTDTQGHLLEVNEAYCRMSGYSAPELLSMRISDLEVVEKPGDRGRLGRTRFPRACPCRGPLRRMGEGGS